MRLTLPFHRHGSSLTGALLVGVAVLVIICVPAAVSRAGMAPPSRIFFSAAFVAGDPAPDRQIYSIEPSGRGLAQLTFGAVPSSSPVLTSDGGQVVFSRQQSLWTMRADGRGQQRIVSRGAEPAWAPDSSRIAYVALGPKGERLGIRTVGTDGKGDRLLVRGSVGKPAWSPDGRSLSFIRGDSLVVLRGGKTRTIAHGGACCAAWSPDGRRIAYDRATEIELVRPDGSGRRTFGPGSKPAWSPNGRLLSYLDNLTHLVVVRDLSRGTTQTLRPPPPFYDLHPYDAWYAWSPRGDAVVYTKPYGHENWILLLPLAGGGRFLGAPPQAEDLAWVVPPRGLRYRPAEPPGPIVSGDELRVRAPIRDLAIGGNRVAFGYCDDIGLWAPHDRTVSGAVDLPLCFEYYYTHYSLALAADRLAGATRADGNQPSETISVRSLLTGDGGNIAASGLHGPDGRDRLGYVLGAGDLLVFSSRRLCEDLPGPNCAALQVSQRPILSQTIWRIRETGWPGSCPFAYDSRYPDKPGLVSGPCQKLMTEPGSLAPTDIDAGRIVAVGENAVVLLDGGGQRLLDVQSRALTALLSGSDLVVLVQGGLEVYDLSTGAKTGVWPMPDVASAGVCRAEPCGAPRLRVEDAARGLVTYVLDGKVHLMRLADGADAVVATGTAARFGDTGLFYAYEGSYPWRGRIRFIPFDKLPVR